ARRRSRGRRAWRRPQARARSRAAAARTRPRSSRARARSGAGCSGSRRRSGAGRRRCSPSRPRASPPRARLSRHRPSRRSPPTPEPLAARTRQSQGAPAAGRGVGGCRERRLWGEALARRRHGRPRWARLDSLIFHRWALASLFRESRYSSGTRGCDPARLAQTGTGASIARPSAPREGGPSDGATLFLERAWAQGFCLVW
ncbi:unnamed protein product, partial [Prorocentrum cordatum]